MQRHKRQVLVSTPATRTGVDCCQKHTGKAAGGSSDEAKDSRRTERGELTTFQPESLFSV